MALVASVAATGGIAGAMVAADRTADSVVTGEPVAVAEPSTTDAPTQSTGSTVGVPATTDVGTDPSTTAAPTGSGYRDGAWLGTAEHTEWGDVQVEVTVSGGQIVDVAPLQAPDGDRESVSINRRAIPVLEADAVALQSADLDVVSGATYTSRSYADSLQGALDQSASADVSPAVAP